MSPSMRKDYVCIKYNYFLDLTYHSLKLPFANTTVKFNTIYIPIHAAYTQKMR